MATKTTTSLETPLRDQLDRLAAFDPSQGPVVSLYLDLRPDQNGQRDHIRLQVRRALEEYPELLKRVEQQLADDIPKSAQGAAVFAATKGDLFDVIPLDVPIENHEVYVGAMPHLYPLAKLTDQYPRYAALLLNSDTARLFVFGLGHTDREQKVQSDKLRRSAAGGWSQARYQRRTNNMHKAHVREVVSMLERIVADEHINQIVVACDDATRPVLMQELPQHLADKVVDLMKMDIKGTPDHQVLTDTLEALREQDAKSDAEEVERMLGAWKAGALGVAGVEPTLKALEMRQVDTLLIAANPQMLSSRNRKEGDVPLMDQLIAKAHQNAARIRFIEDDALLKDSGGVGATLRFKV